MRKSKKYHSPSQYLWKEVFEDPNLTLKESVCFNAILNFAWKSGEATMSNYTLNRFLKFKGSEKSIDTQVGRVVTSLVNKGYITRDPSTKTKMNYWGKPWCY